MSAELRRVYHNNLYLLFLILAFVLAVAYAVTYVVPLVPVNYYRITAAAALAVVLYVALRIVLLLIDRWLPAMGRGPRSALRNLISIMWFAGMGVAIAAALGVDVSSVILGSAFASVILGLAAQTVLSNVIAGVALVVTRPSRWGSA